MHGEMEANHRLRFERNVTPCPVGVSIAEGREIEEINDWAKGGVKS